MAYLLDANVFISAKNLHYGFDFCPAFWEWLIRENQAGKVYSIERVGDELLAGDDDLAEWAQGRGGDFFIPPDATLFPRWRKSAPGPRDKVTTRRPSAPSSRWPTTTWLRRRMPGNIRLSRTSERQAPSGRSRFLMPA